MEIPRRLGDSPILRSCTEIEVSAGWDLQSHPKHLLANNPLSRARGTTRWSSDRFVAAELFGESTKAESVPRQYLDFVARIKIAYLLQHTFKGQASTSAYPDALYPGSQ